MDREAGENKRLSMENEQLNWRMTQEATSSSLLAFRQATIRHMVFGNSGERWSYFTGLD